MGDSLSFGSALEAAAVFKGDGWGASGRQEEVEAALPLGSMRNLSGQGWVGGWRAEGKTEINLCGADGGDGIDGVSLHLLMLSHLQELREASHAKRSRPRPT